MPGAPREPFIAGEAALALLKLGGKTLIPDIQAHWDSYKFSPGRLFSLNHHINSQLWAYLQAFQVQGYNRAPVHIVVQAFEKEARVKIVLPNETKQEEDKDFTAVQEQKKWHGWPNRGTRIPLFQGLQEILEHVNRKYNSWKDPFTFIFEGKSIKILTESQAKTWWRDHLSGLLPKNMD